MKILDQQVGSMYIWSIAIILVLAAAASYALGQFPLPLLFAVAACSAVELLIHKFHTKKGIRIPISGIITGLIVGSVAPYNAPLLAILVICAISILSKIFIKTKHGNIFNPAALGLIVGLGVFSLGDAWWTGINLNLYGVAVPLALLLVIAAYKARRLISAVFFIAIIAAINLATANSGIGLLSIDSALLNVNYFFALLMLADPKTSPHRNIAQAVYGSGVALLSFLLVFVGAPYALLIALLLGNLGYLVYRRMT